VADPVYASGSRQRRSGKKRGRGLRNEPIFLLVKRSHGDVARGLINRIAMIEMVPAVLRRAFEPFPAPVRTLDAIHLAAIEFIRDHGASLLLASYNERLIDIARLLGIPEWKGQ
jgi:hypothetical protein